MKILPLREMPQMKVDNCDPGIGNATYSDNITLDPSCSSQGTILRTWSLSDACGNQTQQIQTITLIDTIAPLFYPSFRYNY